MIRIYLILAFILQPIIGLHGINTDSARALQTLGQSSLTADVRAESDCEIPPFRRKMVMSMKCCVSGNDEGSLTSNVKASESAVDDSCVCEMRSRSKNESSPEPVRFPSEKPIGQRLSEIASIVPVRSIGSVEILFLTSSNPRFGALRDSSAFLSDLSALEAHAVLCVWQT